MLTLDRLIDPMSRHPSGMLTEELAFYEYQIQNKAPCIKRFDHANIQNNDKYYDTHSADFYQKLSNLKGRITKIKWQQKEDRNLCLKYIAQSLERQNFKDDINSLVNDITK